MSLSSNISEKAALIWAIADKLTGVYKPHEYGEVMRIENVINVVAGVYIHLKVSMKI